MTSHGLSLSQQMGRHYPWSSLLHTNRSGTFSLTFLELIASGAFSSLCAVWHWLPVRLPDPYRGGYCDQSLAQCPVHTFSAAIFPLCSCAQACASIPGSAWIPISLAPTSNAHSIPRFNQPWHLYMEPAARDLQHASTLSAGVLDLLTTATEATYKLSATQGKLVSRGFLMAYALCSATSPASLPFSGSLSIPAPINVYTIPSRRS